MGATAVLSQREGRADRVFPGSVLVKPKLVGQFEFAEWTPDNHLGVNPFPRTVGGLILNCSC